MVSQQWWTPKIKIRSHQKFAVEVWISILLGCYAGAWLIAAPVAGYFTDHFASRRTTFVVALLALGGATVLLCIGSSMIVFVLGRVLQGISSAFTWTAAITLAIETVGKHEVGRTVGIFSLGMNLALLLSPLVGGMTLEHGGYYSVFAIALCLVFLDIIGRLTLIERGAASSWSKRNREEYWVMAYGNNGTPSIIPSPIRMDFPDLEPLLIGDEQALSDDYSQDIGQDGTTGRLADLFGKLSIGLTILRDRRLQVALWATFVQVTLITSLDAVLPLFVHRTFSWGANGAGLIFVPVVVPTFLAPWVGHYTDTYGPKWFVSAGFLAACPIWILLRLVTDAGTGQIVLLCVLLTLMSLALALAGAPLMAEITYAVESKESLHPGIFGPRGATAQAYAFYSVSLAGGLLVGPLWAGLVEKEAGWNTMAWTFGLLSALTTIPTLVFTGGPLTLRIERGRWFTRAQTK